MIFTAKIGFKIMVFMFLFNISTGIITYALGVNINGINSNSASQADSNLNSTLGGLVNPVPNSASDTNFGEKVLDFFTLGMYTRIQNFANTTIFAVPTLMVNLGLIDSTLSLMFKTILSFVYIAAIISLFSKGFNNITDDY